MHRYTCKLVVILLGTIYVGLGPLHAIASAIAASATDRA
jgi:hypothetical protein